jgi:hypothetical protein
MTNFSSLSFVPAIPSRNADHVGFRFSVWFDEKVIKHNKSGTVAGYVLGSSLKGVYIKGASTKGTLVSDYFGSQTLMGRIIAKAKGIEYVDPTVATPVEEAMEEVTSEEVEIASIRLNGERIPVSVNFDAFVEALRAASDEC